MRTELGVALAAVVAFGASALAQETAGPLRVELVPPAALASGDRAMMELRVWVPAGDVPVMVTPRAEGAAVEVVRGRLLRPDAVDAAASPLVFRIPIVAREPGPARLRVRVETFACRGTDCRALRAETQELLRVTR